MLQIMFASRALNWIPDQVRDDKRKTFSVSPNLVILVSLAAKIFTKETQSLLIPKMESATKFAKKH